jgi:hypothetical protein
LFRPNRSVLNPSCKRGNLVVAKLLVGRHLKVVGVTDSFDDQAFIWLSRNERRASIATLERTCHRVEPQSRFRLLRAVAFDAVFD